MTRTPTEIKTILARLNARPEKSFGQNFLIDQSVLSSVIEAADLSAGDNVLEIGPGLGVLTEDLLTTGAQVYTIERDRKFIEYLNTTFTERCSNFHLVQGDAAEIDWNTLLPTDQTWKLVANLPYAVASFVLRQALWGVHPASKIVVMVQREVAERGLMLISPSKGARASLLSLMIGLTCSTGKIVRRVSPGSFYPSPNVESAILELSSLTPKERLERWGIEPEYIMKLAKRGFAHPRKQLFSTLGVRDRAEELATAIQATKEVRPEALSCTQWAVLTRLLLPTFEGQKNHGDK